jgi:hypothetical protein
MNPRNPGDPDKRIRPPIWRCQERKKRQKKRWANAARHAVFYRWRRKAKRAIIHHCSFGVVIYSTRAATRDLLSPAGEGQCILFLAAPGVQNRAGHLIGHVDKCFLSSAKLPAWLPCIKVLEAAWVVYALGMVLRRSNAGSVTARNHACHLAGR